MGSRGDVSRDMDMQHHRWKHESLPYSVTPTELGKPVALPSGKARPQGAPIVLRVEEDGASECRPVIARIGVALNEEHHPTRKRADFRLVFHHENT